jgi:hypothetical protein
MLQSFRRAGLSFPGFESRPIAVAAGPIEVELPEVGLPRDGQFRQCPEMASQYVAEIMHRNMQPNPQSGNRIGKRS